MHEQRTIFFKKENDWLQRESYQVCIVVMPIVVAWLGNTTLNPSTHISLHKYIIP
jgi:hypothetical protein